MFEKTNESIGKVIRALTLEQKTETLTTIDIIRIQFFGFIALIIGIILLPVALCREMYKRYTSNRDSKTRY